MDDREIVDVKLLKKWNEINPPDIIRHTPDEERRYEKTPFPINLELNNKIALWVGDISCLNAHAIVHPTNESFTDTNSLSERILNRGGPYLKQELLSSVRNCKVGEVKLTKGYQLPCRYILHTVGPRYNVKHQTAAQTSLHYCYWRSLQLVLEQQIPSVAFPPINSIRKNYPPDEGAHIALRTVRRFLQKHGVSIEHIIFVVDSIDVGIYELLLPLYFPRNSKEEDYGCYHLPEDIGDENGEPFIIDRQIRIIDNPQHTYEEFEESPDLSSQSETCLSGANYAFSQMCDDIDKQHLLGQPQSHSDPVLQSITTEYQRKERYERLLRRAKLEDLSPISGIGCLYRSGVDKFGRPVIVFIGRWFNYNDLDLDKALLYLIYLLDPVVKGDYVVIYFHTLTTSANHPPMSWIRDVYNILDYKYKKNLKAFYIVHPTFWTKLMTWWFGTFMAPAIKNKIQNLSGIEYLYSVMDRDQLEIPAFITEYDMTINGIHYYKPLP